VDISIKEIKDILKKRLTPNRYVHSIGVYDVSIKLAEFYSLPTEKIALAALLHDYAKDLSREEAEFYIKKYNIKVNDVIEKQIDLAHGFIGAELVRDELGINDVEILDAIRHHTMGKENMTMTEKIVFISDYIEPNRKFPRVEILREMAFIDLDKSILMALDNTIKYVIEIGQLIHEDSIYARNDLLIKLKYK